MMPVISDQKGASSVDLVELGLERLDLATPGAVPDEPTTTIEAQSMGEAIRIMDVDPLSVDLPLAIQSLVQQISIPVPLAAQGILRRLSKWAKSPKQSQVGETLNRISALLLAEGFDASLQPPADGTVDWADGQFTLAVGLAFRPLLVDLVARWTVADAPASIFHHLAEHVTSAQAYVAVAYAAGCLAATAPQMRSLAMRYFAAMPECLAQLAQSGDALRLLVVAYRLLRRMPEVADNAAWDWASPLTALMGREHQSTVRLLACECLCLARALSDHARSQLLGSLDLDPDLVARTRAWLVHGMRIFDSKAVELTVEMNRSNVANAIWRDAGAPHPWVTESQLSACVACVGGVLLHAHSPGPVSGLVVTPTVARNIHGMALATSRCEPVLLLGAAGSGKTALVEWLAQRTGNDLVAVHVSSNMDAKVLLGNYVTTQKAGDFEWRPGLLTTAVTQGQWVLIEDIDLAPADVIQTLVPLLESHTLFVASRGESIRAHIQFRLFATLSTHGRTMRGGMDGLLGSSIWTRLEIASLDSETPLIIAGVFPALAASAVELAQAFARVAEIVCEPTQGRIGGSVSLSTSDLIKWCTRLNKHGSVGDSFLVFQEAVDAFTMKEADYERWRALIIRVGAVFGISQQRVDNFAAQHSPVVLTTGAVLKVGRATLSIDSGASSDRMPFADTHHSRCLLERIAACVQLAEPTLLSGETGTGKTTVVQHLATLAGRPLAVFNLSQQSDSSDLLGGFRPVDISLIALRLREAFDALFARTFSKDKNAEFLEKVRVAHGKKDWRRLALLFNAAMGNATKALESVDEGERRKKQKITAENVDELRLEWAEFRASVVDFEALKGARMVFSFVEGALVRAARTGGWILLDEINLATAETLACLGGLLQRERSLLLAETGVRIPCHPSFRLFACMNPSNDVGKRELPPGLRSSFSEFFVHPPDANTEDLLSIIRSHLPSNVPPAVCHRIIAFYRTAKLLALEHKLVDGANQRPHYSLRSLTRALTYARQNAQAYNLKRALYDGLFMTFVTQLESTTQIVLVAELHKVFAEDNIRQMLGHVPPAQSNAVLVQSFWLPKLDDPEDDGMYVVTSSVEAKIKSLARAVMCGRYPVLIQGPTSAGKTSMVQYLARKTGHRFVRINNHEHTDLQEYLGSYTSVDGKLVFEEGLLVKALRHGHWLVLDELNLAPSDVLEALNRLLDDNRELVIPETQEIVRPHPHFMLFATQNPAGLYGGRKALSRAFRNRFVELHFDDIPERELQQIIVDSCKVPPTHAKLLVDVYRNLTQVRAQTRIFEASHGFITLRDLFRWANRHATTKAELAEHGYMLIAERVRSDDEKTVVRRAIERAFYPTSGGARSRGIDADELYSEARLQQMPEFQAFEQLGGNEIAWTKAMRRLFILTALCLRFHEPVLLVGETGCGKTTVCQMLAHAMHRQLHVINCHQNTESSDILGGQRPVRNRNALLASARQILITVIGDGAPPVDSPDALRQAVAAWVATNPGAQATVDEHVEQLEAASEMLARSQDLFAWHDGPLVQAMKQGDVFLMDELNLADDSVLERLNSVLEPSRTLVLAEQTGASTLTASDGFEFVATMNPGGDYGKRELSPALRNRFTELWAPTTTDPEDLSKILGKRLGPEDAPLCIPVILEFVAYLSESKLLQHGLSLRDYLFWAEFVVKTRGLMDSRSAVVHGACLVLLDSIGTQGSIFAASMRLPADIKAECVARLRSMVGWSSTEYELGVVAAKSLTSDLLSLVEHRDTTVGVSPFFVSRGALASGSGGFALHAPTTFDNLVKVLRAMQVGKPLLLEGSPGVGKTTLVSTLARLAGHRLVRINLSDQTDLMDLFGTDLPTDDGFAWCDAPFLQALKQGDWVLLDEINLASQSVLEGLNSCLDHRGTVYISELDREFSLSPGFRLFAAQNPVGQGGGRKGLPRSFVNRFTQVYMDELARTDLRIICDNMYQEHASIEQVLEFNWLMHQQTMGQRVFGHSGAPWEFNLRDVSRFMELALTPSALEQGARPIDEYVEMLYVQRMRTAQDRVHVLALYREVFGRTLTRTPPSLHITEDTLQVGAAVLPRRAENARPLRLRILHWQLAYLESLMRCVEMRWMAILVGPAGSGKTSLVRWLANATGNRLIEFAMNSGVDTSDILGGFEQVDAQRHRSALLRRVAQLVDAAVFACDYQTQDSANVAQLCALYQSARRHSGPASELCDIVTQIVEFVGSSAGLGQLAETLREELAAFAKLQVAGKFEWVDGVLVDALVNGHWLLIDRANLCSASVLDRLNGLLEPHGVLYVNEDPKRTEAIVPHDNFRIFMAVDPQHGELSRAMRNRGIEICVLPPAQTLMGADQRLVAEAAGLPPLLLMGGVAAEPTLTSLVQQAVHMAERIQRGYVTETGGGSVPVVPAYSPDPLESAVSLAGWQAQLAKLATAGNSLPGLESLMQRERLLLAVLSACALTPGSLSTRAFQAIARSDIVSTALAGTQLAQVLIQARAALAAECGANPAVLATAPVYAELNHGLARALNRMSGPAAQWHSALSDSLMFQHERAIGEYYRPSDDGLRELVLQRPSVDLAYVQTIFDLVDGCDTAVTQWELLVASPDDSEQAISSGMRMVGVVPLLRALYLLRNRVHVLMARERGAASELAVAFEAMQGLLAVLAEVPGGVGETAQSLVDSVRGLVMDASHSLRVWALVHPTTLPDGESRALEATLTAALGTVDDSAQRDAVTEALAMLYATVSRKDRHLIVAAVARFAANLSPDTVEVKETRELAPADVIADSQELAMWRNLAQLANIAGSLPCGSQLRSQVLADLREAVAAASVGDQSSWALLYTRLAWLANDRSAESASGPLLSLVSDISYRWFVRLGDSSPLASLLNSPALRLAQPVATELSWRMAPRLDCALGDRDQAERQSRDLLKALAVYQPPARSPADELATVLGSVLQAVGAVVGDASEGLAFMHCSEQVLKALTSLPVDNSLADEWHRQLMLVAAPVADAVEPAANAVRRALTAQSDGLECAYVASVEVAVCLLHISVPRRPVDPAAKARTQWTWLGEDVEISRADLAAYRAIQCSMTGDEDTTATMPFARRVADLERKHSAIELVYRPEEVGRGEPSFAELWQEAHNLASSVLGRVRDLNTQLTGAEAVASVDAFAKTQGAVMALLGTLEQFENRVVRRYFEAYRDVAQIWCGYVRQIRYAMAQLLEIRRIQVHGSMREYARLVAEIYAQPMTSVPSTLESNSRLQSTLAQLKTLIFFSTSVGGGPSPLAAYGELLVALATRIALGVQARGALAPADLEALEIVFRDAYEIHRRAVEERKKRDAEAASLFRHRAPKEQTDEELLGEIFPGFEDVFEDKDDAPVDEPTFQDIGEDTVAALAACHQYVMLQFGVLGARPDVHPALISQAQRHAYRLAASLHRMRPELVGLLDSVSDSALRGANLLALATVASATTVTGDPDDDISTSAGLGMVSVYNFYKDAVPSEAVLLKPLAAAISDRVTGLLEEWPDHAVLQQIGDMAQRLLAMPVTAPVAKLLAALEQLHTRAQDWEAYACRDVSIKELADAARLIIRWRQRELNAWPHLLAAQELEFARRPREWWFGLYASLMGQDGSSEFSSLVSALDQFMQGSPAGEFRGRLNMLAAFASHRASVLAAHAKDLTQAMRSDPVYGPLTNAIDYYLQYAPCIGEQLARAKKTVAKDLAQYVKISSWKDVNPAALRASAQKTHKHLTKCIKQWRDALSQPIFQIIQAYQTASITSARVPQVQIVTVPLGDAGMVVGNGLGLVKASDVRPWDSAKGLDVDAALAGRMASLIPSSLASVAKVLEASPATLQQLCRMMLKSKVFGNNAPASVDSLDEFALQIVSDINHFQGVETPKHLIKRTPGSKKPTKKTEDDTSTKSKKKIIIKSRKQKAEEEEEADEYIEDDEERQKRIKQFWGEQRNLRRTRLKEILKGLQELGLKRHFRPIAEEEDESKAGALLTGLAAVLKQAPVDVAAWQQAVSVGASLRSSEALHGQTALAQRSWQLANAGFFRLNAQVVQLRSATFAEHSTEVNAQQVQHITGLAESLAHTVAKDRRVAADLLASATSWMHSAVAWCAPTAAASEGVDTLLLKQLADQLALLLAQLLAATKHVADAGGWAARAPLVAQAAAGFQVAAAELTKANAALAVAHSALIALQLSGVSLTDAARHMALLEHSVAAKRAVHQAVLAVHEAVGSAAGLDLPPMLLEPWTGPVATLVARITELFNASGMDSDVVENGESAVALAELAGQWATAVMNSWQTIHRAEKQFEADHDELNMWGLAPKELVRRIELMQQMARALHLPTMLPLCRRLTQLAGTPGVAQELVTGFVRPWINRYSLMVQHVVVLYAGLHKTVVQFALAVTAVLTTVIVHGLGTNDIYDSEETDESNASGTGIGEGSTAGAKNVSDEIEGEDQVEGVQGEEPHNDNEDPGKNEDAIDMENDFAGQLGDADLETDNENSSDESSDDEENEMDEQMGDVDPTDPTALDEKLWDDEEEEDEPEDKKGEDSKVDSKASKKKEKSDIVAGDDDDKDDGDGDSDSGGEQAEDSGSEANDSGSDNGDEEEEGSDGESADEDDLDDRVNKDTLDRMAEVEDAGEQLEMPEDLDMGDEEDEADGEDEEDDGLDADMNDLPEDEPIEQKPENMDEDNAEDAPENEPKDDAVEGQNADERVDDEDLPADSADDGEQGLSDGEDVASDEEEAKGDEEEEEEGEGERGEDDEAPREDEEMEESGANKPTDGIDSAMNLDGNDDADPNASTDAQQQALAKPSDSARDSDAQKQPSQRAMQQESFMPQQQQQQDDSASGEQEQQQEKRNMQPERTLADVIEKWERRLDIVMRDEEEEEPKDESEQQQQQPQLDQDAKDQPESDQAPAPESSEFEHVKQDEAFDKVALADANEEELAQQEHQPMDLDDEDTSGDQQQQPQPMDEDDEQQAPASDAPQQQQQPPARANLQPTQRERDQSSSAAQMQQSVADERPAARDRDDTGLAGEEEASGEMSDEEEAYEEMAVDVDQLRDDLEARTAEWRANAQDSEQAMQLWQAYTRLTHDLSLMLTEQLRLILTPTQATQLRGDYRTGKRLNMKRIIPYIASEFRKDKIWLRRTKPARREYQVMVALDNSKSMAQSPQAVELAYETLALVTTALNQLEVGQLSVVSFGESVSLLHPFDRPFDADAGARVLSRLTFADDRTDVVQLMDASLRLYDAAAASAGSADLWRLQLVISDGVCQDHPRLLRQVRAAMEQRIMTVFIVLDRSALAATADDMAAGGVRSVDPEKDSIMNTQHVSFVKGSDGKMEMRVERYLDTFPFKFYVVLRNIHGLPAVLAETLRQYFSLVGGQ
ncbi:AAA ATPase midasin [Coemansia aciculifera]|uniref:Midasin n=1 Tax=Coemansia aciculifera TaxID=417176 RepID=A0A9W8IFQ8_9FUNG|nr:AAA ATPase midasin [Coemansia aciculifera]